MRCWKSWIGLQDKPLRQFVVIGVFQRCTQAVDSPLAAKVSKLPPSLPSRIIQHWKCIFGKRWRRRTAICGEKSCAIADGFPWRINCFPELNDSHLWMAYRTSAVIFLGKLLIAGPVTVANAASSRMAKLARSRKSLTSAYCRYCGAWIEITFALETQSPQNCWNLPFCWNHMFAWVWNWRKWL